MKAEVETEGTETDPSRAMATASTGKGKHPAPSSPDGPQQAKKQKVEAGRVVLNRADCNLDFNVGNDGLTGSGLHEGGFAYCWSGARANIGIVGGKYCFACRVTNAQRVVMEDTSKDQQNLCRVGISRGEDDVGSLGESTQSFGYGGTGKYSTGGKFMDFGGRFGVGDTITCAVDLESRPMAKLSFAKNGKLLGTKDINIGLKGGKGELATPEQKAFAWQGALFPHVLLKNVGVRMQFSVADGLSPLQGYKAWDEAVMDGNAMEGPELESSKACDVIMMVGLPASGKTTWAEKWKKDHPEKRYMVLGTNFALDQMKVPGLMRKKNYGERFDKLMDRATYIFNNLLKRAASLPRNYILDQTNVYRTARIRKLKPFHEFRKIAVVVITPIEELKRRTVFRTREMGKEVPAEAVNEMLANYIIPLTKEMPMSIEPFDEVWFPELQREEAERVLEKMKQALPATPKKNEKKFEKYANNKPSKQSPDTHSRANNQPSKQSPDTHSRANNQPSKQSPDTHSRGLSTPSASYVAATDSPSGRAVYPSPNQPLRASPMLVQQDAYSGFYVDPHNLRYEQPYQSPYEDVLRIHDGRSGYPNAGPRGQGSPWGPNYTPHPLPPPAPRYPPPGWGPRFY